MFVLKYLVQQSSGERLKMNIDNNIEEDFFLIFNIYVSLDNSKFSYITFLFSFKM